MPSSLIVAALAAAWLVVLVPIFARRRQEVSRTTDSALAARVVRRGGDRPPAPDGAARSDRTSDRVEETFAMPDRTDEDLQDVVESDDPADLDPDLDEAADPDDDQRRQVHSDDVRAGRRYRPGRGGFDPEAAAQAARAKYARRQRIVLLMLLAAVTTALLGAFVSSSAWAAHALVDACLIGYLVYLRRQVKIEQDVRERRLARLSRTDDEPEGADERASWSPQGDRDADGYAYDDGCADEDLEEEDDGGEPDPDRGSRGPRIPATANAVTVDIDDEDPVFDELDERTWEPYRRAAGE